MTPPAIYLAEVIEADPKSEKQHLAAAVELRRLHTELEQITQYADALNDRCIRDTERMGALLKALKAVSETAVYVSNGECSVSIEVVRRVDAAIEAAEEQT